MALYVISMEPLRHNTNIHGVTVGRDTHRLALFADDLLIYVSSPTVSLPIILREFELFDALSNFKVNTHK